MTPTRTGPATGTAPPSLAEKVVHAALIALGYLVATLVASTVTLLCLMSFNAGIGVLAPSSLDLLAGPLMVATLVVAGTALLPTIPVGIYAERRRKRQPSWYAKAGVAVGLGALALYALASEVASASLTQGTRDDAMFLLQLTASVIVGGVAAGLAYWAVAGRRAGGFQETLRTEPVHGETTTS